MSTPDAARDADAAAMPPPPPPADAAADDAAAMPPPPPPADAAAAAAPPTADAAAMPPPPVAYPDSKTNPDLPIAGARADIVRLLRQHDFLVVVGDTGSGKTTQLPAYLLEDDDMRKDDDTFAPVAITQPRRVAATSVSRRVAEERQTTLGGEEVGYKVRFDSVAQRSTKLTFMTDGVLVRECVGDGRLTKYRTIVLDEAHERSVDTDVLFGLVKAAVALRKDGIKLRCVVSSATLDAQRFSAYFDGAPVLRVPGRSHPVDIYHSKQSQPMTRFGPADRRYVAAAVDVVVQIHKSQSEGHILIFLTGQEEIETACASLRREAAKLEDTVVIGERGPAMLVLPLYGALPQEAADRVFDPVDASKIRKVVVATNIAETSLTVAGVRFVVDPGAAPASGRVDLRGTRNRVRPQATSSRRATTRSAPWHHWSSCRSPKSPRSSARAARAAPRPASATACTPRRVLKVWRRRRCPRSSGPAWPAWPWR